MDNHHFKTSHELGKKKEKHYLQGNPKMHKGKFSSYSYKGNES
jgi:hypothetical protein